jgi:hypothetical protein
MPLFYLFLVLVHLGMVMLRTFCDFLRLFCVSSRFLFRNFAAIYVVLGTFSVHCFLSEWL